MEFNYLGKTGLRVSELCLGTMTFGRETNETDSHSMMDAYAEAGGNFIDTADVYSSGVSEEIVGRWLKDQPREKWVVATKVRFSMGDGPNFAGVSRKHIYDGVEASLRRLGLDYIDLYQVHGWDAGANLLETLSTLDQLVRAGKVRYIGVSNFTGWQLQKAVDLAAHHGLEPISSLQPLYNLLDRYTEWDLLPVCQNEGIGIIPWSPLRGGWLSGKYQRGDEQPIGGTRLEIAEEHGWSESWSNYNNERTWSVLDTLADGAQELGKSIAQVSLRWLMQRPGVTAPILGARTMEHLQDNLGASGWQIPGELMDRLNRVSELQAPYPHDFIRNNCSDRVR
jgi:aryl-alcohol dehydrogenase-like predicted oxidoreductase